MTPLFPDLPHLSLRYFCFGLSLPLLSLHKCLFLLGCYEAEEMKQLSVTSAPFLQLKEPLREGLHSARSLRSHQDQSRSRCQSTVTIRAGLFLTLVKIKLRGELFNLSQEREAVLGTSLPCRDTEENSPLCTWHLEKGLFWSMKKLLLVLLVVSWHMDA